MNTLQKSITLLLTSIFCSLSVFSQNYPLSNEDKENLRHAIELVDNGEVDSSQTIMDKLLKEYPKNYLVNYEYTYLLCQQGKFKEANNILKKLEKNPEADERLYQMLGNTYDFLKQPQKALKSYQKGLEKFPNSGRLYTEQGNVYLIQEKYDEALKFYEKSIEVDPMYPSSYFKASILYLSSDEPVWGLIYGEMLRVLEPTSSRSINLSKSMVDKLNKCFETKNDTLNISLTKKNYIYLKSKNPTGKEYFEALAKVNQNFEVHYERVAATMAKEITNVDTFSFENLCKLRQNIAEQFADSSVYSNGLFKLHKKIIDAGFWDTYNMFIFCEAFPTECKLFSENEEKMNKMRSFSTWFRTVADFPNPNNPVSKNILEKKLGISEDK